MSTTTSLIHFLQKHWRNTVYSNVWISVCAACMVWQSELIHKKEYSWILGCFAFFSTVFLYNFQRAVKLKGKASYSIPGRNSWLVKNRVAIVYWAIIGAMATAICTLFLDIRDILVLAIPGLFSFLYVLNVFQFKGNRVALRDIPYVKIYLIALSWTALAVWLPLSFHGIEMKPGNIALMSAEKFLFILAITIPFDIRDLKYDHVSQKTIPQILGVAGARWLSVILAVLSLSCTFILWLGGFYAFQTFAGIGISIFSTVVILLYVSESKRELFFAGLLDGTIAFQFVLIAIFHYLV